MMTDLQTAEDVRAHYRALRQRTKAWREPLPKPKVILPEPPLPEPEPEPPPVMAPLIPLSRPQEIFKEVCAAHRLNPIHVAGRLRTQAIVFARQEFCYRAAKETAWSLARIARFLGRDHTTIIWAVNSYCARNDLSHPRDPNWAPDKVSRKIKRLSDYVKANRKVYVPKVLSEVPCAICGTPIKRKRIDHRFCSDTCRNTTRRKGRDEACQP